MRNAESNPPKLGLVVADHAATYSDPIILRRGDAVEIGKCDDEWPGWIWCTNVQGKSGWVPEAFLRMEHGRAFAAGDYDARELNVQVGDRLTVLEEESGWLLCRSETGSVGWVPAKNVRTTPIG
jgi:hypothetical protein